MIRTTDPSDEDSSHVRWAGQVMPTTNPSSYAAEPWTSRIAECERVSSSQAAEDFQPACGSRIEGSQRSRLDD
jgi:hypothetical protein